LSDEGIIQEKSDTDADAGKVKTEFRVVKKKD